MTYEKFQRKGTSRERKARALRLMAEYQAKLEEAVESTIRAGLLNTREAHLEAARICRRVVSPCSRMGLDATIYREAVQRHIDSAQLLLRTQGGRHKSSDQS